MKKSYILKQRYPLAQWVGGWWNHLGCLKSPCDMKFSRPTSHINRDNLQGVTIVLRSLVAVSSEPLHLSGCVFLREGQWGVKNEADPATIWGLSIHIKGVSQCIWICIWTSSTREVLIPLKASFHTNSDITSKANNFMIEFVMLSLLQYHRN